MVESRAANRPSIHPREKCAHPTCVHRPLFSAEIQMEQTAMKTPMPALKIMKLKRVSCPSFRRFYTFFTYSEPATPHHSIFSTDSLSALSTAFPKPRHFRKFAPIHGFSTQVPAITNSNPLTCDHRALVQTHSVHQKIHSPLEASIPMRVIFTHQNRRSVGLYRQTRPSPNPHGTVCSGHMGYRNSRAHGLQIGACPGKRVRP